MLEEFPTHSLKKKQNKGRKEKLFMAKSPGIKNKHLGTVTVRYQ